MWDNDADYRNAYHVEATPHGIFRAVVTLDEYHEQPENEYGCPVLRVESRGYGYDVDMTGYGSESWRNDGIAGGAEYALSKFICEHGQTDGIDMFDRWLRIFHGGSAVEWSSYHYSDAIYVAYDTRAMREAWGQTGDMLETSDPELNEWKSWVEGDVYGIDVERAVDFDDDGDPTSWESTDHSCWGFYGKQYAEEEALSSLKWQIEHTAEGMLPLEVAS